MKLAKITLALTTLFTSTMTLAGTLTAPSLVDILAFDGQRVKSGTTSVSMTDNKTHQVVIQVSGKIEDEYLTSERMVLTFQAGSENAVIELPRIATKLDFDNYLRNQTATIKTTSGKVIPHKQDLLKGEGLLVSARIEDNLTKYNLADKPASVSQFAHASLETKGKIVVDTSKVSEQELQLLFQKADKETQKRFLDWAKKNSK